MEPIGTITMYYPFLDSDTKDKIDSLVELSESYHDFVLRLAEKVCTEEVPLDAVVLAATHAHRLGEKDILQKISRTHSKIPSARALTVFTRLGVIESERERFRAAFDEAIGNDPSLWIQMELYWLYSGLVDLDSGLQVMKDLIEKHPELSYYKQYIFTAEGLVHRNEGKMDQALASWQDGLRTAKEHDDLYGQYYLLMRMAEVQFDSDSKKSLELLEEAYGLVQVLASPYHMFLARIYMAILMANTGEYGLALQSLAGGMEISETLVHFASIHMARVYAYMGDGESALEWSDRAIEFRAPDVSHAYHLTKAHALILLGRLEEASEQIGIAHERTLEIGVDAGLILKDYVTGLYEMADGNFGDAITTLSHSYQVCKSEFRPVPLNHILLALVEAEIALAAESVAGKDVGSSGPWMAKLDKKLKEHDLPGIDVQASLLKARFFVSQDRIGAATVVLERALHICNSRGLRLLKDVVNKEIAELEAVSAAGAGL